MRAWPVLVLVAACAPSGAAQGPDASAPPGDADDGADAAVDAPPAPAIHVLRGVDRATAFSLDEAKVLASTHGVKWTGVYIGGPCSGGSGWTKAIVQTLAAQLDWTFMPIYVGQQSPVECGAHTFTAAQGTSDGEAAAARMAQLGWAAHANIPVCLDLERVSWEYSPAGAEAYAHAWRDAVRAAGYLAYLYGNPTMMDNFFDAGVKFDGVWPAHWLYTGFASVAPEDLPDLGGRYVHQNRAWQYAGEFGVPNAGAVDGDTSDLLLAPAPM